MKLIRKLTDYIDILTEREKPRGTWFRGHADVGWKLLPSLYRYRKTPDEIVILKKFKQSANLLLEKTPESEFDWLFWMQHYGIPTRLLDWSESPLAALYFAVSEEKHIDVDGCVWFLDPVLLNKNNNNIDDENFVPSFEDEILLNYMPSTISAENRTRLPAMAAIATRNNPRIQAQLGVFTIYHRDDRSLVDMSPDCLEGVRIEAKDKLSILRDLSSIRFDRFSLFPELSSIGEGIKLELSDD